MMLLLIFQQCMKILTLPIHVLAYFGLWNPICKRIFPFLVKTASKSYNARMHKEKETLFKNMRDFANASGNLHLLEIGVGPGTNFEFYPPNSRVTCVDYNPNFRNVLLESMAQNTHLQFESFVVGSAENISSVPDGSVDVVVGTLVLCSVNNAQAVLKEILRVLRPGGVYYFMEHVAADRSTWTYFWQQVCNPTWGHVGDGCSLLKESWKYIENAGFSKLNLQHIIGPLVIYVMRPHIYGYGVKKPDKWRAVVGLYHLYIHWPFSKEYHIKDIIIHSDYEFGTFENDVALFRLMQFVKYNDYVQPICLPDSALFLSDKSKNPCYISGWGSTKEKGKDKHILQEAQVDIIPLQICNSYDWYAGTVSLKMICAGSESGHVDSCQEDSGGPLACYFPDASKYYLIGITSSGVGCGRPKFPGLYVRAASYKKWIYSYLSNKTNIVGLRLVLILGTAGWITFHLV